MLWTKAERDQVPGPRLLLPLSGNPLTPIDFNPPPGWSLHPLVSLREGSGAAPLLSFNRHLVIYCLFLDFVLFSYFSLVGFSFRATPSIAQAS